MEGDNVPRKAAALYRSVVEAQTERRQILTAQGWREVRWIPAELFETSVRG